MRKHFLLYTNDPRNGRVELTVSGKVNGYVNFFPRYARLFGAQGETIQARIKILPTKDHPFTIKSVKAKEGQNIKYDLKPLGETPTRDGYELIVRNTRQQAGVYRDFISIETDLKAKPSLSIPVSGRIMGQPPRSHPSNAK